MSVFTHIVQSKGITCPVYFDERGQDRQFSFMVASCRVNTILCRIHDGDVDGVHRLQKKGRRYGGCHRVDQKRSGMERQNLSRFAAGKRLRANTCKEGSKAGMQRVSRSVQGNSKKSHASWWSENEIFPISSSRDAGRSGECRTVAFRNKESIVISSLMRQGRLRGGPYDRFA